MSESFRVSAFRAVLARRGHAVLTPPSDFVVVSVRSGALMSATEADPRPESPLPVCESNRHRNHVDGAANG